MDVCVEEFPGIRQERLEESQCFDDDADISRDNVWEMLNLSLITFVFCIVMCFLFTMLMIGDAVKYEVYLQVEERYARYEALRIDMAELRLNCDRQSREIDSLRSEIRSLHERIMKTNHDLMFIQDSVHGLREMLVWQGGMGAILSRTSY